MEEADADLDGNNLQKFVNRTLKTLIDQLWPADVRSALTYVDSEVVDHGRGLRTFARVKQTYSTAASDFRWPPEGSGPVDYSRIEPRTPALVVRLLTEHLEALLPQVRDAIARCAR
jgi:hypothetical protein